MFDRNPDPDQAFSFIRDAKFDVFCLQEVPPAVLDRLKTLPYNCVFGVDRDRIVAPVERAYCVILSPHAIQNSKTFPFSAPPLNFLTKIVLFLGRPLGMSRVSSRGAIYADIDLPKLGRTRVFCLHLALTSPGQRQSEFDTAMALCDSALPTIACGDFNILERPHITILNWLLGGRFRDIFAWSSDRRSFEQRFSRLSLVNPLRGKVTQTISRSQLDHILIPSSLRVTKAEVQQDRIGSDHHPILVETE